MEEEFLSFAFYDEWTTGYQKKLDHLGKSRRQPHWFAFSERMRHEAWYAELSWSELGLFTHLAMLSLATRNRIPMTERALKASCSRHGGISVKKTINKLIDLSLFFKSKPRLHYNTPQNTTARSGIVGPKNLDISPAVEAALKRAKRMN